MPDETLARTDVSFDNSMDTSKVRKEIARQNPAPSHFKIENLRVGMKKINVTANVIQTAEPAKVLTQFRDNAVVSNATIGDESGKILLCLWDQQINSVHRASARLTTVLNMISWCAHFICFINPYNAIICTTAITKRTIVPAMKALLIPAATPIMLLFNDAAREAEFAHQNATLPISPMMLIKINNMKILWIIPRLAGLIVIS